MKTEKFGNLFYFLGKSNLKASDGTATGSYPFYTSSSIVSKRINKSQYNTSALIFGTGGSASIHYINGRFSVSSDCFVAASKEKFLDIKYVYYYLLVNIELLERGFRGAGIQHISKKYIQNIEIPVIPFKAQNRIVAILDKAAGLVKKSEDVTLLLQDVLSNAFLVMFQDYFFNLKKVPTMLSDIATIVAGFTKGRKTEKTNLYEIPYLRVANVQDGYFNFDSVSKVEATIEEIEKLKIKKHDIFLTEGGDADKLGRAAIWQEEETNFVFQNHLFRVRLREGVAISPIWLFQLFVSPFGKGYFFSKAKQTTGIASINSKQVKAFPIPDVSFDKQKNFEYLFFKVKESLEKKRKALFESKELFQSLAKKAFEENFELDIEVELERLVNGIDLQRKKNDLSLIVGDKKYLMKFIEKLRRQEFPDKQLYDKAKHALFQLITEEPKVVQIFDQSQNSIKILIDETA